MVRRTGSGQTDLKSFTEEELRRLLLRQVQAHRGERLEHFRQRGRRVVLSAIPSEEGFSNLISEVIQDEPARPGGNRLTLNRILSLLEVGILLGFLFLFIFGSTQLKKLNQTTMTVAFALPTLTPTPPIRASLPPTISAQEALPAAGSQAQRHNSAIHGQPSTHLGTNLLPPTPGPELAVRIQIPAIRVDAPVVQGDGEEQLKKGVGQSIGTANPGEAGNMVLSGHNDIYGEVFRYLDRLKPGDEIIVYSMKQAYVYEITGWELVDPNQVEVMLPTSNATVTLISCYPYLIDTERIIVKGVLVQ